MTARGPVPKRSDQRRRTNSPATEKVPRMPSVPGTYKVPLADSEWHPLAKRWWKALRISDQTQFYQPSDWEHAYAWTQMWSDQLTSQMETGKLSAMFLATWDSAMGRLLITEGDRRRVRIELERTGQTDPDKEAGVASMTAWRKKLAGSGP
jgi:hypothetical protein